MRAWVLIVITFVLLFPLKGLPKTGVNDTKNIKCAQIYYDRTPKKSNPDYYRGRVQVIALQNLLSHFPHIQQYIIPIDLYQKGQLERCQSSIYIGSYYYSQIPKDFIEDFVNTQKNVAWINYNINKLSDQQLQKLWSVAYIDNAETDWNKKDKEGRPGVYNFYSYKGQTFERCNVIASTTDPERLKDFYNAFDITMMKLLNPQAEKYVLSWATHTTENKKIPYILRNNNHWYIADDPFHYICEGDRYFIFADILFDILDESPEAGGKKYALVRYEDVSPKQTLTYITRMADLFKESGVHFAISLIPIYEDPFAVYHFGPYLEMTARKNFVAALNYAKEQGASFILHGVTHQYDHKQDPFSGVSGEDFEFWDRNVDKPVQGDSVDFVLNRLDKGMSRVYQAGLVISAWVTPHYLASPLDNVVFGRVFSWSVSRGNYDVVKICHLPTFNAALTYDAGKIDAATAKLRKQAFKNMTVEVLDTGNTINQLLPYPIYGDYYHRNVLPEDLGNIQPFFNTQVIAKRSIDQMIQDAKRYSVLRDVWASFFIHDILLNTKDENGIAKVPGDTSELKRLIQSIRDDGYEFVDLKKWVDAHPHVEALPPIETDPPGGDCSSIGQS